MKSLSGQEKLVTTKNIKKGEILSEQNISVKRPAPKKGIIQQKALDQLLEKGQIKFEK